MAERDAELEVASAIAEVIRAPLACPCASPMTR